MLFFLMVASMVCGYFVGRIHETNEWEAKCDKCRREA